MAVERTTQVKVLHRREPLAVLDDGLRDEVPDERDPERLLHRPLALRPVRCMRLQEKCFNHICFMVRCSACIKTTIYQMGAQLLCCRIRSRDSVCWLGPGTDGTDGTAI